MLAPTASRPAVTYKPAPGLTIDLHTTLLDAKYVSFTAYSTPTNLRPFLPKTTLNSAGQPIGKGLYTDALGNGNLYNASGNTLAEAPQVSLSLAVQKDFDLANGGDLFCRGEFNYQSRVYFDPTNAQVDSQAAYSIVNGSIGYSPAHSHWTVSVWGKNMADTRYIVGAQSAADASAPPSATRGPLTPGQLHLLTIERPARIDPQIVAGRSLSLSFASSAAFLRSINKRQETPDPIMKTFNQRAVRVFSGVALAVALLAPLASAAADEHAHHHHHLAKSYLLYVGVIPGSRARASMPTASTRPPATSRPSA